MNPSTNRRKNKDKNIYQLVNVKIFGCNIDNFRVFFIRIEGTEEVPVVSFKSNLFDCINNSNTKGKQ